MDYHEAFWATLWVSAVNLIFQGLVLKDALESLARSKDSVAPEVYVRLEPWAIGLLFASAILSVLLKRRSAAATSTRSCQSRAADTLPLVLTPCISPTAAAQPTDAACARRVAFGCARGPARGCHEEWDNLAASHQGRRLTICDHRPVTAHTTASLPRP